MSFAITRAAVPSTTPGAVPHEHRTRTRQLAIATAEDKSCKRRIKLDRAQHDSTPQSGSGGGRTGDGSPPIRYRDVGSSRRRFSCGRRRQQHYYSR